MKHLTHRIAPLTPEQKQEFLHRHLPDRIRLVEQAVRKMPQGYNHFTVAAVHGRALAQFLGLALRKGHLALDNSYFAHEGSESYEVKAQDLSNQPPIDISTMSREANVRWRSVFTRSIAKLSISLIGLSLDSSRQRTRPGGPITQTLWLGWMVFAL